jgi:hypothetical protein
MSEWWEGLETITQGFFSVALFFSVFFVWQLIASIMGLAGDSDVDIDGDVDMDADGHFDTHSDALDSVDAFQLLSVRSLLAFFTLFSWAGALYLQRGDTISTSMLYAVLWGVAAMLVVAASLHLLRKMTETGNTSLASCVGKQGTVYLDVPASGLGEVRIAVSGHIQCVKARSAGDATFPAGASVTVTRQLGPTTIEVSSTESN